jgi:hypothetical protein
VPNDDTTLDIIVLCIVPDNGCLATKIASYSIYIYIYIYIYIPAWSPSSSNARNKGHRNVVYMCVNVCALILDTCGIYDESFSGPRVVLHFRTVL